MNRIKSPLVLTGTAIILLTLGACSGKNETIKTADSIRVQAIKLNKTSANNDLQIVYNGTLEANKTIDLSFQVSGTINSFSLRTGDYVKKGQLIATVDETTYRNQYNALVAQARLAEENYKRTLAVFEKGSMAEIKMLEARSNFEQANSSARATYQNIAHTKLYAPQSGYIGEKNTDAGAIASPGQPVAQLLDIRSVDVLVAVPENEINRYKAGDLALVSIDALGTQVLEGRVAEVGVLALNNSASYNLKVKLNNTDQKLRPGMLCKVRFAIKRSVQADNDLVVPLQAVQVDEQGQNFVYTINEKQQAIRKVVKTGPLYNQGISISSGLTGTEQLVTSGFQKLTEGTAVIITK